MQGLSRALLYRGEIKAVIGVKDDLAFVTVHPENQATALYFLDPDNLKLRSTPLPSGGVAVAFVGKAFFVAGSDGFVHKVPAKGGAPVTLGEKFTAGIVSLVSVAEGRLAVASGEKCYIVSQEDGKILQTLDLPATATTLATDPTEKWLAVGTDSGVISVFEAESQGDFEPSDSAKIHEGMVTGILFDLNDLRFFSTGTDLKLYNTYARGSLEPEDRGRGFNHEQPITAIVHGPGGRFYTGAQDAQIKGWPPGVGTRPITQSEGLINIVGLAAVAVAEIPHLAVICHDNSIRIFELDAEGKFKEQSRRADDAMVYIKEELSSGPGRRESALKQLAEFGDVQSLELIAKQMKSDPDHALRLRAVNLLSESNHPKVTPLLEDALTHNDEKVRTTAFKALVKAKKSDLRPLELALRTGHGDIGELAIDLLEGLASKDDQALARLEESLNANEFGVRKAALFAVEKIYPKDSPEASIRALNSNFPDLRRLALIRLYQRKLLDNPQAQSAARRSCEDSDAGVRQVAFLLTVSSKSGLQSALTKIDQELTRQFDDLNALGNDGLPKAKDKDKKEEPAPKETEPVEAAVAGQMKTLASNRGKVKVSDADLDPLLQATASRALDTCLRGARGLAVLGDPRAFPLLLQLSREENPSARAEVCRAIAALDDPRAVNRLRSMLFDSDASVRDAAFTAMIQIHQSDPLLGADSGLSSPFEDVRRRALGSLMAAAKAKPPKETTDSGALLLLRALNDGAPAVRLEAFKSTLGLKIGGGGEQTLRFALQSVHSDVRREVLTEVMAQFAEEWAQVLLSEFLNDPDAKVREDAFEFWLKKSKELETLKSGLTSKYADTRLRAVEGLIRKKTKAAQELLVTALNDADRNVRTRSLNALIDFEAKDRLTTALTGTPDDVRVGAATALAVMGDPAGKPVLLELANREKPDQSERVADWSKLVTAALDGLNQLGDPSTLDVALSRTESTDAGIRAAAGRMLVGLASPTLAESIRPLLRHSDNSVKYPTALALALTGDIQVAPLAFASDAVGITDDGRLAAALALGTVGEDRLLSLLDSNTSTTRDRTLLVLMLLELISGGAEPTRLLSCLSAMSARVRLTAGRALEAYADSTTFENFVVTLFNNPTGDREEKQVWKVESSVILDVARLLAFGSTQARYRTVLLLDQLNAKDQETWDHVWGIHARRFADELKALASKGVETKNRPELDGLRQLAFGAFVGLVREQGESRSGSDVIRLRQSALARLLSLAQTETKFAEAAKPVLTQALSDPNQGVRTHAFLHLQTLNTPVAELASEALSAGYSDLAVKGLELLTDGTSKADGEAVLEREMLARTDNIALEAAKLLAQRKGRTYVGEKAIGAASEQLRSEAVEWLNEEYSTNPEAQKALRTAVNSRYLPVRNQAAFYLGAKKDPTAFDVLVSILNTAEDSDDQNNAVEALVTIGDKRTPAVLMDRIENDPAETADKDSIIYQIGEFRDPAIVDRLIAYGRKSSDISSVAGAVYTISGYDQWAEEETEDNPNPDRTDEKEQHPRHGAVLAKLVDQLLRARELDSIDSYMNSLKTCRTPEVDPILNQLTLLSEQYTREQAVLAIAWRARFRNGPIEPLQRALKHKDPRTQFLAAEGLALAKRNDGLSVLQSAIEYLDDYQLRQRAVLALGVLGDKRSFDLLLKLANENGHALQDTAAQAIGRLGQSEKAEEVFRILARYAKRRDNLAKSALTGLRWFNTRPAWDIIRAQAVDTKWYDREYAVALLGYDNDQASKDLLIRLIATPNQSSWVRNNAVQAARKVFGPESLEPDFAIVRTQTYFSLGSEDDPLQRILDKAPPDRLLNELPFFTPQAQELATQSLTSRKDLSVEKLVTAVGGKHPRTVRLAAQLLGRSDELPASAKTALTTALNHWTSAWETERNDLLRGKGATNKRSNDYDDDYDDDDDDYNSGPTDLVKGLALHNACLEVLCWASGRHGGAETEKALAKLCSMHPDAKEFASVRNAALDSLAANKISAETSKILAKLAAQGDVQTRVKVAEILGQSNVKEAVSLLEENPADYALFRTVSRMPNADLDSLIKKSSTDVHSQSNVLTTLIARKDLATLSAAATDTKQPEVIRLGAIEGLAALADPKAEEILKAIGTEKGPVEIKKAAWRGVKRSRRFRTPKPPKPTTATQG